MSYIRFNKTNFVPPKLITETEYFYFKEIIISDPSYVLDTKESKYQLFYDEFHFNINATAIGVIGILLIGIITCCCDTRSDIFVESAITILSLFFIILMCFIILLILEGPSYFIYLENRTSYYSIIKYSIIHSNSYDEFINKFNEECYLTKIGRYCLEYRYWQESGKKPMNSDDSSPNWSAIRKYIKKDFLIFLIILIFISIIFGIWSLYEYFAGN